jgi:tetratricopeptide (TPR) repeat protein
VGRRQDATALFEKVLESRTATLGPGHDDTRNSVLELSWAYQRGGHLDRAERLLRDALDGLRAKKAPKSGFTGNVLVRLGEVMLLKKHGTEAEALLRECLALRMEIMPEDWRRFSAMSLLGGSLLAQGKYAEAEPMLLQGYEGLKQRAAATNKSNQADAAGRIVRLYEATGQPDKAREWREKLPPGPPAKSTP